MPATGDHHTDEANHIYSSIESCHAFPTTFPNRKAYIVEFTGPEDTWDPQNWSPLTKLSLSIVACYGTFIATLDSALFAAGTQQASRYFSVSQEVGTLGTSLYVVGFASGPLLWAPASEMIGRRWPLSLGMLGCSIFSIGAAVSKDVQTLLICRFFAGVFGASPLCVAPAVLADMYNNRFRGMAISVYALTVFVGPFAAPSIGGFISTSYLRWRWTLYLPAIMSFSDVCLLLCFYRGTYAPLMLVKKASSIRKETQNWLIHAEHEKAEFEWRAAVDKYFMRPLHILMTEPIALLLTIYMSFIYGLTYALLEAYPYIFESVHGMSGGVAGLPFIGLIIGQLFALAFIICQQDTSFVRATSENTPVTPEMRLPPAILGSFVFTAGLFWFAWTSFSSSIHWIAPTAAGVPIGFGLLSIFLSCFNYIVDAYLPVAASAVAANIILRSGVAAGFPLFSKQMFENLGIQWAGTLLACLAAIMIPLPLLFRWYGPRLRMRSQLLISEPEREIYDERV